LKTSLKVCNTKAVLIDGFNLIYKFPHLQEMMQAGRLPEAMKGLLELLRGYQKKTGKKIRVVFDGKKQNGLDMKSERVGKIDVFYSLESIADTLIMQFIKDDPRPELTAIVTSDKEIESYANRHRAPVIHSETFAELINEALKPEEEPEPEEKSEQVNLSADEISFWEKMFKRR